jgi:hypothetical protein
VEESKRRSFLPVKDIKNTENPILCISNANAGEELISLCNNGGMGRWLSVW